MNLSTLFDETTTNAMKVTMGFVQMKDFCSRHWEKHGWVFLVVLCLFFLLIYAFLRRNEKGTWSEYVIQESKNYANPYQPNEPKISSGERECKRVLETIFKQPFPKERPNFLRNDVSGGNNLELDCFNSKLNLAVEYNGAQHYKFIPYFHKNKEAFMNQKYRDELKRRMCSDYGINLIEVPYTIPVENIQDYLVKELRRLKYV
jgi:hypothetical protein